MSWRTVVVTSRAKLDLKLNYMVIRGDGITRIFLGELSTLIIESTEVSITACLLCELAKRKVKVIFCDEKRNPCFEAVPYNGSHDTSAKIRKQIKWDKKAKNSVWTDIVTEKINQQMIFLKYLGLEEYKLLEEYIENMEYRDETNREGHASKVYFNALFGKGFTRNDDSIINAALNYGYTIILSAFNREIVASGYLTQVGVFHDNMFNYFNLSSDLMEPFRILVDKEVYKMMDINKFEKDEKMRLVNILNKEVVIDGKRNYVNNAIKIYCKSVFEAINENDTSLIKFYRDEL